MFLIKGQHPIIEHIGCRDRRFGGVELGVGDLGIGVDIGLLIDPSDTLQGADVEGILRAQIAWVGGLNLAGGFIIQLFLLQSLNLGFSKDDAVLCHFGFQGLQAILEVGQVMAQPDGADA